MPAAPYAAPRAHLPLLNPTPFSSQPPALDPLHPLTRSKGPHLLPFPLPPRQPLNSHSHLPPSRGLHQAQVTAGGSSIPALRGRGVPQAQALGPRAEILDMGGGDTFPPPRCLSIRPSARGAAGAGAGLPAAGRGRAGAAEPGCPLAAEPARRTPTRSRGRGQTVTAGKGKLLRSSAAPWRGRGAHKHPPPSPWPGAPGEDTTLLPTAAVCSHNLNADCNC